jgi:predicted Zn finger-like uncharacterized protein
MSLATRCNACGTMFRVVQDQLRVSEGWVRCGRCDAVFNALDALVDLDAEPAVPNEATPDRAMAHSPPEPPPPRREPFLEANTEPSALHEAQEPAWGDSPALSAGPPSGASPDELAVPPAPASIAPALLARDAQNPPVEPPPAPGAATARPPAFVRQADRDAQWNSPAMRVALIGCSLMLLALLALQGVYHFRDAIAASSPTAAGWLRSACARWDCSIEAPRRIRDVTLEGSGLSRVAQQSQAVKLSISLRNRGRVALTLPSVELTLTDLQGQLIARRVLSPADFRIDPPLIAAGAELPVEVVLSAGGRSINGYTVELFYP